MKDDLNHIAIIGLGYVGLPLLQEFVKSGLDVTGYDVDASKINSLKQGISYIPNVASEVLKTGIDQKKLNFTEKPQDLSKVDAVIICVPTPIDKNRNPDLSYVIGSVEKIAPYLKKNSLISLESTTYPGTTRKVLGKILEKNNFTIGKDIFLCFSPEREDPGNKKFTIKSIPKVISGFTQGCLNSGKNLYSIICDQLVPVSNLETAEMTKLIENIQRSVNIALMNELKIIAEKLDINIFEAIDAADTKPFGFKKYYPGPGVGGHCIPVDPFYLTYVSREYGIDSKFIELSGEMNRSMKDYLISRTYEILNSKSKALSQAKILCLGLGYKPDVSDTRESPAVDIFLNFKKNLSW
jgi:UDP-N-acetyl-D-glucosamine dehydrogenase